MDHGDDVETCGRQVVGISPGGRGTRIIGIYLETAGDHCVTGGMLTHL